MSDTDLIKYWKLRNNPEDDQSLLSLDDTSHPDMEPLKAFSVQFIQSDRLLVLDDDADARNDRGRYREEQLRASRSPIYQISDLLRDKIRSQITRAFIQRDTIGNRALNTWLSQGGTPESKEFGSVHQLAEEIDRIELAFS